VNGGEQHDCRPDRRSLHLFHAVPLLQTRTYVLGATLTLVLFAAIAGCSSSSDNGGFTKACGAAVDAYSASLNGADTDAQTEAVAIASFDACTATGWEVAAEFDHIDDSRNAHDILAFLCFSYDHARTTRSCGNSVIKSLTDSMD
jgi:hypothetical protein